ncbi:MAG: helix-turn-helix domain-containing protein [Verrucomicrobiota bacterium]
MNRIENMNLTETGEVLRSARRAAGLTQAELARRLGMSRATLSQLENGVIGDLGIRKVAMICDRLGLEILVRPRRVLTLQEAYSRNREERQAAFRETDSLLANLKPGPSDG